MTGSRSTSMALAAASFAEMNGKELCKLYGCILRLLVQRSCQTVRRTHACS